MTAPTLHQAFAALGYYSVAREAFPDLELRKMHGRPVFRRGRFIATMTSSEGWAYLAKVNRKLAALNGGQPTTGAYKVRFFDARRTRKGKGSRVAYFTDAHKADEFAARHTYRSKPATVEVL